MIFEILVEDQSGQKLLEHIFSKYKDERKVRIEEHYRSYRGIGGFKKGKDALNIKSQHLLDELSKRLRALQEAYRYNDQEMCIAVVVDNDKRDTSQFYQALIDVAHKAGITADHFFSIAVEEMEAWMLGDFDAIVKAYPKQKDRILSKYTQYNQDSICGTWEVLADLLTKNGLKEFRTRNPTFAEIGKSKYEWADLIGRQMKIRENKSPSFQKFLGELDKRCVQ